jgi:hypothetical protein
MPIALAEAERQIDLDHALNGDFDAAIELHQENRNLKEVLPK